MLDYDVSEHCHIFDVTESHVKRIGLTSSRMYRADRGITVRTWQTANRNRSAEWLSDVRDTDSRALCAVRGMKHQL